MPTSILDQLQNIEPRVMVVAVAAVCAILTVAMTAIIILSNTSNAASALKASCHLDNDGGTKVYAFRFPAISGTTVRGDFPLPRSLNEIRLDCADPSLRLAPLKLPSSFQPTYKIDGTAENYVSWAEKIRSSNFSSAEINFKASSGTVAVPSTQPFEIVECDTMRQFVSWLNR
jgi:hypothetical protein